MNLDNAIKRHIKNEKPIFGICLGMQLLFTTGYEFKSVSGLNCIQGNVVRILEENKTNNNIKVPNIGWRNLNTLKIKSNWKGTPFQKMNGYESLYFAHSFKVVPKNLNIILANCEYGELEIPAAIKYKNIFGCQFHPEKSGPVGLEILNQFLLG